MLKKLLAALLQGKKKTVPEPARAETSLQQPRKPSRLPEPASDLRMLQPRITPKASRSVAPSQPIRHDDSLTNPLNPLSPLNPMNSPDFHRRADAWIESRCEESHRSSAGTSGGSDYSSGCSSSSSDSGSSCSSSCD